VRTALDLPDLTKILAPFDLRPRRVRALEAGTINSNYRVETDGGTVFVRVNEGKSEADVRWEAALLWHLGVRRFPTPQPLRKSDGAPYFLHEGKPVSVFPWVAGRHVDGGGIGVEHVARVGAVLAELHRTAASFGERREGIYTFGHIARRVDRMRADPRVAEVLPALDEEIAFVEAERAAELPSGIIHGDLFPDNVLWKGDEIAAVLDFEQASVGRYAYDLAVAMLAWCWSGADVDDARAEALVTAYARVRPLDEAEQAAFLVEARLAALRFTVTRLTDVHLAGVEDRPGKDYRDYLARLERLRASLPGRVRAWMAAARAG